jgi:hypothetical protein
MVSMTDGVVLRTGAKGRVVVTLPRLLRFQLYLDNFEGYLLSAYDCGASVQVGSVLQIPRDTFATPEPASPDFFALLRRRLPFQKS